MLVLLRTIVSLARCRCCKCFCTLRLNTSTPSMYATPHRSLVCSSIYGFLRRSVTTVGQAHSWAQMGCTYSSYAGAQSCACSWDALGQATRLRNQTMNRPLNTVRSPIIRPLYASEVFFHPDFVEVRDVDAHELSSVRVGRPYQIVYKFQEHARCEILANTISSESYVRCFCAAEKGSVEICFLSACIFSVCVRLYYDYWRVKKVTIDSIIIREFQCVQVLLSTFACSY